VRARGGEAARARGGALSAGAAPVDGGPATPRVPVHATGVPEIRNPGF
jgi:hypothetical protein